MRFHGLSIAVTGGAGFIGSHLVDQLLSHGNEVVVFDNFATGSLNNLPVPGSPAVKLRVVHGDVRDLTALEAAFAGVDVVFHLATHCVRLSINQPAINHDVNATGTLNALLAAKKQKLKRFIYCSSSEVFGNAPQNQGARVNERLWSEDSPKWPTTLYGATKLAGENYALAFNQTYDLPAMVLRPFNAYGPRSHILGPYGEVIPRFAVLIRAGIPLSVNGDGHQTRDFTYVEDTARALLLAGETDALLGDSINLAHGEEVSVLRLTELLSELSGSKAQVKHLPDRPGDIRRLGADVAKAKRMLNAALKTPIREGLARYLKYLDGLNLNYSDLAKQLTEQNWNEPAT